VVAVVAVLLGGMKIAGPATAAMFDVAETQVTGSAFFETTPTFGDDGTSRLVVFTSRELLAM
jgi:hypothetical protein